MAGCFGINGLQCNLKRRIPVSQGSSANAISALPWYALSPPWPPSRCGRPVLETAAQTNLLFPGVFLLYIPSEDNVGGSLAGGAEIAAFQHVAVVHLDCGAARSRRVGSGWRGSRGFHGHYGGEPPWIQWFGVPLLLSIKERNSFGGVDGTRTRDPRRDRPVF